MDGWRWVYIGGGFGDAGTKDGGVNAVHYVLGVLERLS